MTRRDWACECGRRRCREKLYLTEREYRRLALLGRVVSPTHADGPVVQRVFGAAVIQDTKAGGMLA